MTTLSEYLARLGKKGGQARAKKMTAEERSDAARKAVEARWAREKEELRSTVADISSRAKELEKRATRRAKVKKEKPK
jgi:hypothetical protein